MAEDYYKTLGVKRDASQAEIQKAYRELARKYHPDLNPQNPEKAKKQFQQVQAAFDVLNDPGKREMYDRYGSSFESYAAGGAGPRPGSSWNPYAGGSGNVEDFDFSQFFGERFGGDASAGFGDLFNQFRKAEGEGRARRGRARTPSAGAGVAADLNIPFTISVTGGTVPITLARPDGATETLDVKIPVGIEDGKRIRLRGQGGPGPDGGTAGDLLITIHVDPHPWFQRRGKNLHVRVPVTLAEAVLGAKVEVPSPHGSVVLRVPAGTSSGAKLRVRGHGVKPPGGTPGDLYAEIQIQLPAELTDEDREQIRQIDARHPLTPRRDLRW